MFRYAVVSKCHHLQKSMYEHQSIELLVRQLKAKQASG